MLTLARATELVAKFDRTKKYPADENGLENLARGLQRAADATGVSGARIVDECVVASEYCPTDFDMLTVAREIARGEAVVSGKYDTLAGAANHAGERKDWERQYGPPQPFKGAEAILERGKVAQKRHRDMWLAIRSHLKLAPSADFPSWKECARAARELGYTEHAEKWENAEVK